MLPSERREKKQGKIRNSEYYGMESIFDTLYAESRNGKTFNHLMAIIESEENIKLAYRTIKRNHGSKTPGVDKKTIRNLAKLNEDEYVRLVKKKFSNYHPRPVRREEIPKDNGKTRPLGIPAISDRIVQQCILQVMEPICEAKFSENSNGFRPNRSAETAIAQCCRLIQVQHLYHVVDLDIKGFFDNINHTKLIRQIWSLGIRDKKLLCIIKQMLKAPVILPNGKKIYPTKGTPQGGILSPLLANIVLNELDWWIASQWENMPTRTEFTIRQNRAGAEIKSHVYRALRRSNLKEMHSVRYADDFKIFCSSHTDAVKAYHATAKWLKDRLGLDISPEKSRIVNLKRQYSEFLGFKLKVQKRSNKYVVKSHMCDKAYKKVQKKLTEEVKKLEIPYRLNSMVLDINKDKEITVVSRSEGLELIKAKAIILAMGCRERPRGALNIPGYRPAGIYTAGTAQRLMNIEGHMVGKEVVILGSGDIGLIMARRMTLEGAKVKVVAELMPYSGGLKRNIVQCLNDFDIPLKLSHTVVYIEGKERGGVDTRVCRDINKRMGLVERDIKVN